MNIQKLAYKLAASLRKEDTAIKNFAIGEEIGSLYSTLFVHLDTWVLPTQGMLNNNKPIMCGFASRLGEILCSTAGSQDPKLKFLFRPSIAVGPHISTTLRAAISS